MEAVSILSLIFGFVILALSIIGGTIIAIIKIVKGGGASRKGQKLQAEEARMIQEVYQGLSRMEERVGSLETILMDKERKEKIS